MHRSQHRSLSTWNRKISGLLIVTMLMMTVKPATAGPLLAPAHQTGVIVDPTSIAVELSPGKSRAVKVTVQTASTPISKLDVLFLFDVTGSMSEELEAAKARGTEIMNTLRSKLPDSTFGVASFSDYPGYFEAAGYGAEYGAPEDYPWRLDQELTHNTGLVQRAIDTLFPLNGQDPPEDYATALFETLGLGWRPGAKHVIVLFGDAPAHDPTFYLPFGGQNFGVDPGPDGLAGTEDDLGLSEVVELVRNFGLEIIVINSDPSGNPATRSGFDHMAVQTGGQVYSLFAAEDLGDVVSAGLTQAAGEIGAMALIPEDDFAAWALVDPVSYSNVAGGETRTYMVTIQVPAETPNGVFTFNLVVTGDLAHLAAIPVTVIVGRLSLDASHLLEQKQQLITDLSTLRYETEFLEAKVTLSALPVNYADEEAEVATWLAQLPSASLTPAQLSAVYRLTVHEEALHRLWLANAQAGHIGNSQVAHVVGLAFSVITFVKYMQGIAGKSVVGLLVNKLAGFAIAKLVNMITTIILSFTDRLPNTTDINDLRVLFKVSGEALQAALENHLRTTNFAREFNKAFLVGLLESLLVAPLDLATSSIYVSKSQSEIPKGLQAAIDISRTSLTLPAVEADALRIIGSVNGAVVDHENAVQTLQSNATRVADAQTKLSLLSDFADLGSVVLALTGVGGIAALIGQLASIAIRAFDAGISVGLGTDAYYLWFRTPDVATNTTNLAFSLEPRAVIDPSTVRLETEPRGFVPSGHLDSMPTGALSAHSLIQLKRLKESADTYQALLQQLGVVVSADDTATAETVVEQLLDADVVLSEAFLIARQPIYAGATSLLNKGDPAFSAAYSKLGRSAGAFDGEGAILYVYLLGWLTEPHDGDIKRSLLNQIEVVMSSVDTYESVLVDVLPFVEDTVLAPSVVVTGYTLPDQLVIGRTDSVHIDISNPSPSSAHNVTVSFDVGKSGTATSTVSQRLDTLAGGESRTLEFSFVPSAESGLLSISTQAGNGSGTFRMIYFTAERAAGGAGLLVAIVLGVVALSTVLVVTDQQRRRRALSAHLGAGVQGLQRSTLTRVMEQGAGRPIPIAKTVFSIGRGRQNSLSLADPQVSRRHAIIRFAQGRWFIQDQGSIVGTFVNGQRVTARALNSGDRIRIGTAEFEFRVG